MNRTIVLVTTLGIVGYFIDKKILSCKKIKEDGPLPTIQMIPIE
jgi:hypothetical protein